MIMFKLFSVYLIIVRIVDMTLRSISDINALGKNAFESTFANVIELCKDAAVEVERRRPFKNVSELCGAFQKYLLEITEDEKLRILRLHPDLAGRLASNEQLTRESAGEQRSAGLNDLTEEQRDTIQTWNERYKSKYGFPFIICARENKVQSIIEGLQRRYHNTREQEINMGISEVNKICRLRILDIVQE